MTTRVKKKGHSNTLNKKNLIKAKHKEKGSSSIGNTQGYAQHSHTYSELEKDVYIEQLEGITVLRQKYKICKFVKSLFGLKQALKHWDKKFDEVVLTNGYVVDFSRKLTRGPTSNQNASEAGNLQLLPIRIQMKVLVKDYCSASTSNKIFDHLPRRTGQSGKHEIVGYNINESNKCVYSKCQNDKGVIIYLYVDEMLKY
ncbi:Uncharacterized protein TCM_009669 [Theobroma cacao]|uniref:Reverse transcriptase Ty1/copia-type domain-containing protein n=1 Tax=Theobroma cacao TaxID=3641 RepID=A0A061E6Z0_THECC|nr:Uncharacterized protein TCM_009669 [Theobroma cacao]